MKDIETLIAEAGVRLLKTIDIGKRLEILRAEVKGYKKEVDDNPAIKEEASFKAKAEDVGNRLLELLAEFHAHLNQTSSTPEQKTKAPPAQDPQ